MQRDAFSLSLLLNSLLPLYVEEMDEEEDKSETADFHSSADTSPSAELREALFISTAVISFRGALESFKLWSTEYEASYAITMEEILTARLVLPH